MAVNVFVFAHFFRSLFLLLRFGRSLHNHTHTHIFFFQFQFGEYCLFELVLLLLLLLSRQFLLLFNLWDFSSAFLWHVSHLSCVHLNVDFVVVVVENILCACVRTFAQTDVILEIKTIYEYILPPFFTTPN